MMKKILLALGFAVVATSASASGLRIDEVANVNNKIVNSIITSGDGQWGGDGSNLTICGNGDCKVGGSGYYEGYAGKTGTLVATQSGFFTATYLGKVAGFDNMYIGNKAIGDTFGATDGIAVTAGEKVNFFFKDGGDGSTFANGGSNKSAQGILFLDASIWNASHGTAFDFLIGYNDTATINADYDDYVVGVVNSVPVPAALPLMASALGAFGYSRRKNKAKAA
jgi:hypothetical protein